MGFYAALFILLICFHSGLGLNELRWCTVSDLERRKCDDMKNAFAGANLFPALSCVAGHSASNCVQMIVANQSDAVMLDGNLIYQAGKQYNLKLAIAEVYDLGVGISYYAVAVVHRNSTLRIDNLKGAKSCHTGLGRTAGWKVPIGLLTYNGQIPVLGCDFQNAAAYFFNVSCVPGVNKTVYAETLCGLCSGSNESTTCEMNAQEKYYDYAGAFRCLAEGPGEVAFVKHSTVFENTDGNNPDAWAQGLQSGNYQLLCLDGSRQDITKWRRCHLAKVPARSIMLRQDSNTSEIFRLLNEGQKIFHDGNSIFKMFNSAVYGGKDLLFRDATTELIPITNIAYQSWLPGDYLNTVKGFNCDLSSIPANLRWCTVSIQETWKCSQMAMEFRTREWNPPIQCVSAATKEKCMQMIKNKEVDAVTLGGQNIYLAGKTYGLVPAAGESYPATGNAPSYYAIAVVKRNRQGAFTFNELKGKKSCHTGYGRTAGWNIPIGILVKRGIIFPTGCNMAKATSEFFSASCVPGANQKGFPSSLCNLCKGTGQNKCEKSLNEPFFSYPGAFRCLSEDAGEVAFVKHSTVFQYTDGNSTESWALGLKSTDYQLLCLNGAVAEVTEYASCNWGQVPAHVVMVRPDTNIYPIYGLLGKAQEFFGVDNSTGFSMFDSTIYNGTDLIFRDATKQLVPVVSKEKYTQWLGKVYMDALEGMQCSSAVGVWPVSNVLLLLSNALVMRFHL